MEFHLHRAAPKRRAFRRHRVTQSSAHRFLHERGDPCLFGGGQLLQREGGRPHGAFVEVRLVLKPNVAYLVLNFCALWKKQTTLPSLAYAGIPYQSLGERAGALALMIAWSRSPMARSGSGIAAIFASTALSPSALSARGPRRPPPSALGALLHRGSFLVRESLGRLAVALVLLADFCVPFFAAHSSFLFVRCF